jgi:hypothetical protein
MIRNYRTPVMMHTACGVLIHVFTIALAPYFVHFCDSWVSYGREPGTCPAGYAATIVYTTIVMLLYNVQQDIERPFDMTGLDDVFFELADEFDEVRGLLLLRLLFGPRCTWPVVDLIADSHAIMAWCLVDAGCMMRACACTHGCMHDWDLCMLECAGQMPSPAAELQLAVP